MKNPSDSKSLCDQAMDAVQSTIGSQQEDNRLTTSEANVFNSAMLAFYSIAIRTGWPAESYLRVRDGLLKSGWLPKTELQDIANLATQRKLVANKIIRPEGERNFSFSEGFVLIHPDVEAAEIEILGSESHGSADLEDNSLKVKLPREFWNVSVLTMASEFVWKASSNSYSREMSDYVTLNHVRTKGFAHYENSKRIKVSGSTAYFCRDGQGNYFSAEASGLKLADGEIPISFTARADSRMM